MDVRERKELKALVAEALAERDERLKNIIQTTVDDTLTKMGMDITDPLKMQVHFQKLETWTKLVEALERKGWTVFIGFLITVALALMWTGLKNIVKVNIF